MMELTKQENVEKQLLLYIEAKRERDRAQINMDVLKGAIGDYFDTVEDSVIQINLDPLFDIKATCSSRSTKKLDKVALAEHLKVSESALNRDFLIKSVDDRKLTFNEFQDHHYRETNEGVSIRLVKAVGEKK